MITIYTFVVASKGTTLPPSSARGGLIIGDFESCEWDMGERIKIYHYIADSFGLAEYFFSKRVKNEDK